MSEILDIANEMAHDLLKVGAMDEITMRKITTHFACRLNGHSSLKISGAFDLLTM